MELIYTGSGKKVYRDGDRLVKSFDESYTKAMVLNEALNQARVEETDLHIPKILEVSNIGGFWSVSWEFIEGETLAALMDKDPSREDEYLNLFVDLQIEMSEKKVSAIFGTNCTQRSPRAAILRAFATICMSVSTGCPATKSSAMGTFSRATSSSRPRAFPISSTGRTRRRATPPLTRRGPTSSFIFRGRRRSPRTILPSGARRRRRKSATSSGCFPSWRRRSPSRLTRRRRSCSPNG